MDGLARTLHHFYRLYFGFVHKCFSASLLSLIRIDNDITVFATYHMRCRDQPWPPTLRQRQGLFCYAAAACGSAPWLPQCRSVQIIDGCICIYIIHPNVCMSLLCAPQSIQCSACWVVRPSNLIFASKSKYALEHYWYPIPRTGMEERRMQADASGAATQLRKADINVYKCLRIYNVNGSCLLSVLAAVAVWRCWLVCTSAPFGFRLGKNL